MWVRACAPCAPSAHHLLQHSRTTRYDWKVIVYEECEHNMINGLRFKSIICLSVINGCWFLPIADHGSLFHQHPRRIYTHTKHSWCTCNTKTYTFCGQNDWRWMLEKWAIIFIISFFCIWKVFVCSVNMLCVRLVSGVIWSPAEWYGITLIRPNEGLNHLSSKIDKHTVSESPLLLNLFALTMISWTSTRVNSGREKQAAKKKTKPSRIRKWMTSLFLSLGRVGLLSFEYS